MPRMLCYLCVTFLLQAYVCCAFSFMYNSAHLNYNLKANTIFVDAHQISFSLQNVVKAAVRLRGSFKTFVE